MCDLALDLNFCIKKNTHFSVSFLISGKNLKIPQ